MAVIMMRTTTTGTPTRATDETTNRSPWQLLGRGLPPASSLVLRSAVIVGIVLGAAMIVASAAIHLHLWKIGYRQIHLIGPSFLAQAISGFVLAALLILRPRVIVVVAGFLFCAGSIGALVLSATVGFLGSHDNLSTPWAGWSFITELVGGIVLAACAVAMVRARSAE
jgi:hypothetical protein